MNEPGNSSEKAAAPMLPGPLTDVFSRVSYRRPFRRYQALALEAFEKARAEGRHRSYLVLPPGAGKTALGLEIARRLGNQTLALGPNTASRRNGWPSGRTSSRRSYAQVPIRS